ncbi:TonB-dependent receptor [Carboxylicivirga sp. RSCT41]|uniref:TonB-dependent receptor n=1 Tax=Carboxylicivirga agarovorans TaxID=3417570 RepID=UPI003D34C3B5
MKLIVGMLFIGLLHVSAAAYSQGNEISIKSTSKTLKEVFKQIEQKSNFTFLYNDANVDLDKKVTVEAASKNLNELLDVVLEGSNLSYRIVNNQVVIFAATQKANQNDQQQSVTVRGSVTDSSGEPMPGVSVVEKGTTTGTITGIDGTYSLELSSAEAELSFSFIGFETQVIQVAGRSAIDIILVEDVTGLDEVVVVGFGTQKKENVTGANSYVKMGDIIADRPITSSAQALQGVAAGLQVVSTSGRPGAPSTNFNIRGFTSITGGGPLVLVDNVPMSINDVNPRDIESVSVLKDAAAASIYGARAAFGVILVTTKKAQRNEKMRFNYSTTNTFSSPTELPEKATTRQFVEALNDWGVNSYFAGQETDLWLDYIDQYETDPGQLNLIKDPVSGSNYALIIDENTGTYYPLADTDVIGDFLDDTGFSTIHNFSMSGGSENISYRMNAGYSSEDGIMVTDNDSYEQFNLNSFVDAQLTKSLKSSTTIYYKVSERSNPIGSYASAIQMRMYDPTGHYELIAGENAGDILPFDTPGNMERYRVPGLTKTDNLRLFEKLEFNPIKDLVFTGEITYQKGNTVSRSVNNQARFISAFKFTENSSNPENTSVTRSNSEYVYNALNLYGNYSKTFGNHNVGILAGFNREKRVNESFNAQRKNLISVDQPYLGMAIGDMSVNDGYTDWAVMGYFARLNYNYKQKYFLEANGRYDGSSRFAEDSRFGFFPSFSGGWNIARESFMENVELFTTLKLRASWGEVGNQAIADPYPMYPGYAGEEVRYINLDTDLRYNTVNPAQLISPLMTWETVQTTNLGLDVAILKNRLSTSVDVYSRKTLGMLIQGAELPAVLGVSAPMENAADLETRGWEVEIAWKDKIGQVDYGLNFNISNSQSEILKFDNEAGLLSQYYVGQNVGEIWGYVTDGYYTVDDFVEGTLDAHLSGDNRQLKEGVVYIENQPTPYPGDVKYVDLDGNGYINNGNGTLENPGDRKVIGNNRRRYQFGLNGYANYKNFDFSFVLSGVGKRDLNINTDLIWPYPSGFDHIYKHQLDYWTPDNQDAFYPRIYGGALNGNSDSNYARSRWTQTKYLSNGAYLRIQNITFGYTLPQQWLQKIGVEKLRVFAAANNILTIDDLPQGIDADIVHSNQIGNGGYPFMKSFSVGLNLSF